MAAQDGQQGRDITGPRGPHGGGEDRLVLAADPEAELFGEVMPVEQLDRVGEAALPDLHLMAAAPSETKRMRRAS